MSITGKTVSTSSVREARERRKRFRAALALAGRDAKDFAKDAGVGGAHLSQVLHGHRESAILVEKIEAFIEKHLGAVAA